jgi:hypothetical protein
MWRMQEKVYCKVCMSAIPALRIHLPIFFLLAVPPPPWTPKGSNYGGSNFSFGPSAQRVPYGAAGPPGPITRIGQITKFFNAHSLAIVKRYKKNGHNLYSAFFCVISLLASTYAPLPPLSVWRKGNALQATHTRSPLVSTPHRASCPSRCVHPLPMMMICQHGSGLGRGVENHCFCLKKKTCKREIWGKLSPPYFGWL